jgi:hypothetical protein
MKPWRLKSVERSQEGRLGRRLFWRRQDRPFQCAFLLAAIGFSSACLPHEEQRLSCDDVYPPGQFDYRAMEALIVQEQTRMTKGCLGGACHSPETQRGGIRLDTRDLIYEELSTRPELYYETLTTGYMPHDGVPWDEEDLKIFRSWYCAGAFPP